VSLAQELSGLGSTRVVRFSASGWRRIDEPDDVATGPENAEVSRCFEPVGTAGAISDGGGRASWVRSGSSGGGRRAAAIYTLIQTAKLNDVDPRAWLADVLARIADHTITDLAAPLPWNWRPARRPTPTSTRISATPRSRCITRSMP
jgi:IS66 C-terminal element